MKVFCVRIGDTYGPEYETYLKSKLDDITFVHEPKEDFVLQWNKIHFFNLDLDEPVVVIDIDVLLMNDYMRMFDYPIERGEFLTIHSWWEGKDPTKACYINGGFYKFYPTDTKYIYEEFKRNRKHWEMYFIKVMKLKKGPVGGEENFVEMMVKQKLKLKTVPDSWVARGSLDKNLEMLVDQNKKYPGEGLMYAGGEWNEEIKFVHYTLPGNHPDHSGLSFTVKK